MFSCVSRFLSARSPKAGDQALLEMRAPHSRRGIPVRGNRESRGVAPRRGRPKVIEARRVGARADEPIESALSEEEGLHNGKSEGLNEGEP